MSEDILGSHDWGSNTLIWWIEARNASKHRTMAEQSLPQRIIQSQTARVSKLGNPDLTCGPSSSDLWFKGFFSQLNLPWVFYSSQVSYARDGMIFTCF